MVNCKKKLSVGVALTTIAFSLMAIISPLKALANNSTGQVQDVAVGGSIAYIRIVGGNYNSCSSNRRYIVDLRGDTGRAMYAMVLSAKLVGASVTIIGSNNCSLIPGDAEGVNNTAL